MKKSKKTLTASVAGRLGAGEGSSPTPAGEGHIGSIPYHYIRRIAIRRYGVNGEDVAGEAWLIAHERGYFHRRMLSEAARRLGIGRTAYAQDGIILLPPREGMTASTTNAGKQLDPRLHAAMQIAPPPIAQAMLLVLQGYSFFEAAEKIGISPAELSTRLARLGGRKTGQGNLFMGVGV